MTYRTIALAALLLCGSACGSSDDSDASFDYGRDDMRSAIEGTWEGTSRQADGSAGPTMTLKLVYSTADARTLCDNRILSRIEQDSLSPQCGSTSSINVTGVLTAPLDASDTPRDLGLRGSFVVMSLRFDGSGMLSADVDGRRLEATLSNEVLEGNLAEASGSPALTFSARRQK